MRSPPARRTNAAGLFERLLHSVEGPVVDERADESAGIARITDYD
jgi:hypothetical protein